MHCLRILTYVILSVGLVAGSLSCSQPTATPDETSDKPEMEVIRKRRADGTLSSVNQVDETGRVHGLRVSYFEDGKTVYSKISFSHGQKQGPSIRYYRNGQVFEHSEFQLGKKHGLSRKYHKNGALLSECSYKEGYALPGLMEYREDGTLITNYPEVKFREIDHLAFRNRVDLEITCNSPVNGVKYYRLVQEEGRTRRIYLISEKNAATLQFYVAPGASLEENLSIRAEIPTEFGNIYARELHYALRLTNTK